METACKGNGPAGWPHKVWRCGSDSRVYRSASSLTHESGRGGQCAAAAGSSPLPSTGGIPEVGQSRRVRDVAAAKLTPPTPLPLPPPGVALHPPAPAPMAPPSPITGRTCLASRMCSRVCGMGPSVADTTRIAPSICKRSGEGRPPSVVKGRGSGGSIIPCGSGRSPCHSAVQEAPGVKQPVATGPGRASPTAARCGHCRPLRPPPPAN